MEAEIKWLRRKAMNASESGSMERNGHIAEWQVLQEGRVRQLHVTRNGEVVFSQLVVMPLETRPPAYPGELPFLPRTFAIIQPDYAVWQSTGGSSSPLSRRDVDVGALEDINNRTGRPDALLRGGDVARVGSTVAQMGSDLGHLVPIAKQAIGPLLTPTNEGRRMAEEAIAYFRQNGWKVKARGRGDMAGWRRWTMLRGEERGELSLLHSAVSAQLALRLDGRVSS